MSTNPSPQIIYLRCTSARKDSWLVVGEIYAAHWDKDDDAWTISFISRTESLTPDEIAQFTEPATKEDFHASLIRAMSDLESVEGDHRNLLQELQGINHLALTSGEAPEADTNASALAIRKGHSASQLRNRAHSLKRKIATFAESVKSKRELVESKIRQQMALFQAKADEMSAMVQKLEAVVHMVNLYLGRDEQITRLRDGPKAADETPISLRQSVLYMDEECALAESHGIDFEEIEKFDQWLLAKPEHLTQVMPEAKGIVVLQVRRNPKKYDYDSDNIATALDSAQRNQENMKSYWLIRNGSRLHRLWTDVSVGPRLIPKEDELDHFFFERHYDHKKGESVEAPLRPGSKEYYAAMERANAHRRHYMRLMLVVQGILDRTQLLTPYKEGSRLNLLDPSTWDGQLRFLRDEEGVLTDGRPSFDSWLSSVNKELRHGLRIVGNYPTWFDEKRGERCRVHPRFAQGVNESRVRTLLKSTDGEFGFKFLFERTDNVQRRDWYSESKPAKRRGSYGINASDDFFVCIDNASVADMQYYLADRRHRKDYERMIPLLREAISLKEAEAKQEQPFRNLLLQKLSELHPEAPCSPDKLESLIKWWKLKVKEHRPLLADDSKAYRMILSEYARQVSVSPALLKRMKEVVTAHVTRYPDTLALWHAGEKRFVALRSVDGYPVFAHQEIYTVKRDTAVCIERNEWMLPKKSDYLRWELLHSSSEWAERPETPNRRAFLAPIHYPAMVAWAKASYQEPPSQFDDRGLLLAIYARSRPDGMDFRAVRLHPTGRPQTFESKAVKEKVAATDYVDLPELTERGLGWDEKSGELTFTWKHLGGSYSYVRSSDGGITLGWQNSTMRVSSNVFFSNSSSETAPNTRLLFLDEKLLIRLQTAFKRAANHNRIADQLSSWCRSQTEAANDYLLTAWESAELEKYTKDGGDPEFFRDHLKTIPKPSFDLDDLDGLLERCLNKLTLEGVAGLTFAEALRKSGVKVKTPPMDIRRLIESDWILLKAPERRKRRTEGTD